MGLWQSASGFFSRSFGYSTPASTKVNDTDADWDPELRSTDGDIIGARPYIEARIKDLIQTDGFLAGALETHCNHVVGNGLILSSTPDFEALGISEEQADELSDTLEREWGLYTGSSRNWHDAGRRHNWAAFCAQAYKSYLIHGEILAIPKFRRNQEWGACTMLVDPNRLATPKTELGKDSDIRAGIRLNKNGEATAYYIHNFNPLDSWGRKNLARDDDWVEVAPYSRTGRKRVIHHFDPSGTEQTRGISIFAPAVEAVKRQHDLSDATLKAAIYQTLIAAVIKSELSYDQAMAVIGAAKPDGTSATGKPANPMVTYQKNHLDYYKSMRIKMGDLKAIHLLPNEDLELRQANISPEYSEFAKTMNREAARGTQLQLESYTGDYGGLSYSGGQLSIGETERGHSGRRVRIMAPWAQDVYELFLEELFIRRPELMPAGATFWTHRDAISKASWIGPPPLIGDPAKLAKASETRLMNRISTMEYEAAQIGMDWRNMLRQQKREQTMKDDLGLVNQKLEEIEMQQKPLEEGDVAGDGK